MPVQGKTMQDLNTVLMYSYLKAASTQIKRKFCSFAVQGMLEITCITLSAKINEAKIPRHKNRICTPKIRHKIQSNKVLIIRNSKRKYLLGKRFLTFGA